MDYAPEYIARLQQEFSEAINDLLFEYLLWSPRVEPPEVEPIHPSIVAVVVLNDGRSWHVHTDIETAATTVSRPSPVPEKQPPF